MVSNKTYPDLAKLSGEIARCGRCGFCQSVCPVYQVRAHEEGVARGRNMFARMLLESNLPVSRKNEAFFTECLLCRACTEMCFSAVKTDEIVLAMRRENSRIRKMSSIHRYLFNHLLPDQRRLGRAIRFASRGRNAGAIKLTSALDIFGWYGSRFQRIDETLSQSPKTFFRERTGFGDRHHSTPSINSGRKWSQSPSPPVHSRKPFLFIGCGINFMFPEVGEATVTALAKLGHQMTISENACCGLPAYAHGAVEAAQKLAMKNMRLFSESGEPIITDCSSCASFLKSYPKILGEGGADKSLIEQAEKFAARVYDVTEVLAEAAPELAAKKKNKAEAKRVTFHDPCHLSRHQKLSVAARQVLQSLPSVDFHEMKEADWCCGGAGTFAFEHPDLSLQILERKIRNIEASGAEIVATTCPSCMMQLRSGLKNQHVKHLVEIIRDHTARGT